MQKTKDGRFIETRIILPKHLITNILISIKTKNAWTWNRFSEILSVSSYTLSHDIIKIGHTLPLSVYNKILTLANDNEKTLLRKNYKELEPFWGQKSQRTAVTWKIPHTNTEEFAEFYGIMLGDGCIYSNLSSICISGNSLLDRHYIENYVSKLIIKLFEIKPKINYHKNENSIRCIINSKNIAKFLIDFGFPKGKKKLHSIKVPQKFSGKPNLLKACLRGLNDTDGSIYPQNSRIIIDMCIKTPTLLKSVIACLKKLNLDFGYTKDRVYFSGEKRVNQFITIIGSSNLRNILKHKHFLEKGYAPKTKDMKTLLKQNSAYQIKLPYNGPLV